MRNAVEIAEINDLVKLIGIHILTLVSIIGYWKTKDNSLGNFALVLIGYLTGHKSKDRNGNE